MNEARVAQGLGDVKQSLEQEKYQQTLELPNWAGDWQVKKRDNADVVALYELANEVSPVPVISDKRLWDMWDCGNYLDITWYEDGTKHVRSFNCRVRLCPICQWRRWLKLKAEGAKVLDWLKEHYPKARYLFVTFTQRNCPTSKLGEELDKMTEAFSRLMEGRRSEVGVKLKKSLLGYQRSIETTINPTTLEAHAHIHALLVVKPEYFSGAGYIRQSSWVSAWKSAMRLDYEPVVDVRVLKSGTDVVAGLRYSVKSLNELNKVADRVQAARVLADLTTGLAKRKLVSFGGAFRVARKELGLREWRWDTARKSSEEAVEAVLEERYSWIPRSGVYVLSEASERLYEAV